MCMGCRRRDAVFEIVEALFNIPALLVAQVDLPGWNIQIAAEGEIPHTNLFQHIHGSIFFLAVILVSAFHEMSDQFRLSGIITEGVDEISFVSTGLFPVPDSPFVVGKHTVPFTVICVLVELRFHIHRIVL